MKLSVKYISKEMLNTKEYESNDCFLEICYKCLDTFEQSIRHLTYPIKIFSTTHSVWPDQCKLSLRKLDQVEYSITLLNIIAKDPLKFPPILKSKRYGLLLSLKKGQKLSQSLKLRIEKFTSDSISQNQDRITIVKEAKELIDYFRQMDSELMAFIHKSKFLENNKQEGGNNSFRQGEGVVS